MSSDSLQVNSLLKIWDWTPQFSSGHRESECYSEDRGKGRFGAGKSGSRSPVLGCTADLLVAVKSGVDRESSSSRFRAHVTLSHCVTVGENALPAPSAGGTPNIRPAGSQPANSLPALEPVTVYGGGLHVHRPWEAWRVMWVRRLLGNSLGRLGSVWRRAENNWLFSSVAKARKNQRSLRANVDGIASGKIFAFTWASSLSPKFTLRPLPPVAINCKHQNNSASYRLTGK